MRSTRLVFVAVFLILTIMPIQGALYPAETGHVGQSASLRSQVDDKLMSKTGSVEKSPLGFPKLYGVNIRSTDWENWSSSEIDEELVELKNLGFNFVRFEVYFHRIFDWQTLTLNVSMDKSFYEQLLLFTRKLEEQGMFYEPLLMESWKFGDDMQFWWTNTTLQNRIYFFYRTFAQFLKSNGCNHTVYLTLWSEASYYYEWADGAYVVEKKMPNYEETNADWKEWLSEKGLPPVNLTIDNINLYIDEYVKWSRDRFNLITQIKAKAVKDGWPGMLTAAEMGYPLERCGTGPAYHPSRYLQLCAKEYVDVLCMHDYADSTSWMLEPYATATKGKIVVVNELGPPFYLGVYANDTEAWWKSMEPKMEFAVTNFNGFAIWCWTDYETEPWGLKNSEGNVRPVLQLIGDWLGNQTRLYAR